MTSVLYLEDYLDGLESLPTELQRNFTLMRDLDSRAQTIIKNIDEKAETLMKEIVTNKANLPYNTRKERISNINKLFSKAREYGDDKVQLAIQTYELVDKHIRRLDSDLARFESEIQDKTMSYTRSKSEDVKKGRKKVNELNKVSSEKKRKADVNQDAGVSSNKTSGSTGRCKKAKKPEIQEESIDSNSLKNSHTSDVLDMPVDPNEPTYCLCHQVSYGEMIGCDNPDCPIEWFHFACVGLTTKPKGKWFCPKCTQERKKK